MQNAETSSAELVTSEEILDGAVEAEMKEGKQGVTEFTDGVEERAENVTTTLTEMGLQTKQEATMILNDVHEYAEERTTVLGNHQVGDIASEGAAAWNDKAKGNEIVYDMESVSSTAELEYWERVRKHEEIHQQEQAKEFNLSEITYDDETVQVNPVLTEWHACQANIPSDLTPEYQSHVAEGERLVAYLGSDAPLKAALKSGDMQALQEAIEQKEIERLRTELAMAGSFTQVAETFSANKAGEKIGAQYSIAV